MVDVRSELACRRAAEPEVPADAGRHGRRRRGGGHVGVLVAGVGVPGVHGEDLADAAGLDELHAGTVLGRGMDLVPHLGADLRLRGLQAELAGFPDGMGEGLLAIDVLAEAHGHHGRQRMHVVRRRDADGVEGVAELGVHLAEIREAGDAGILGFRPGETRGVDIAEGDILGLRVRADLLDVVEALRIGAHGGNLQLGVQVAGADEGREGEGGQRGGAQEVSTRQGHG